MGAESRIRIAQFRRVLRAGKAIRATREVTGTDCPIFWGIKMELADLIACPCEGAPTSMIVTRYGLRWYAVTLTALGVLILKRSVCLQVSSPEPSSGLRKGIRAFNCLRVGKPDRRASEKGNA